MEVVMDNAVPREPSRQHTFVMTEEKAELVFKMADSQQQSYKNWIASAVERGEFDYAKKLVGELRQHQRIYAAFNMDAKRTIAGCTKKDIETTHLVKEDGAI
jgi:hypothetical protein